MFIGINIVIGIWFVVDLGILRGTKGTNNMVPIRLSAGGSLADVT